MTWWEILLAVPAYLALALPLAYLVGRVLAGQGQQLGPTASSPAPGTTASTPVPVSPLLAVDAEILTDRERRELLDRFSDEGDPDPYGDLAVEMWS